MKSVAAPLQSALKFDCFKENQRWR